MAFKNFRLFFGPFVGTVVKNAKLKNLAPGNDLHFSSCAKNLALTFWLLKYAIATLLIA